MHEGKRLFEHLLAQHCAPTLQGVKPASLISVRYGQVPDLDGYIAESKQKLGQKGLAIYTLCQCKERVLLLIYRPELLQSCLFGKAQSRLLASWGYPIGTSLEGLLKHLEERVGDLADFPHEIGLFLGYPVRDVTGFITQKGCGYKFCGYWKVYGNEAAARARFAKYTACQQQMLARLKQGQDLYEMVA